MTRRFGCSTDKGGTDRESEAACDVIVDNIVLENLAH